MSIKGITVGETINQTMEDMKPKLIQIFDSLKAIWDTTNDPLNVRNYLFDITGTTWPDFKLTGAFYNNGDLGSNTHSRIDIIISGPYGSHLDSEMLYIVYDTTTGDVVNTLNNFTLISTLARVILFIEEMVTYCGGLAAFPADTVVVNKV